MESDNRPTGKGGPRFDLPERRAVGSAGSTAVAFFGKFHRVAEVGPVAAGVPPATLAGPLWGIIHR